MNPSRLGGDLCRDQNLSICTRLCQPGACLCQPGAHLCQLLILLPSSNQDIQMIVQEVSSAQKLFQINQVSFKCGQIYKSKGAGLCNKGPYCATIFRRIFFSATMIAVQCGSNRCSVRGQMMGFSWKNLGPTIVAQTTHCRSVSV